jgi:hypothetical protein
MFHVNENVMWWFYRKTHFGEGVKFGMNFSLSKGGGWNLNPFVDRSKLNNPVDALKSHSYPSGLTVF